MGIKSYKPRTPGLRQRITGDFAEITKRKPEKSLCIGKAKTGGRGKNGRISTRFRGGGHKKLYRIIDFKRDKIGIPAKVASIEYDPNRSARIALLHYLDGEKRYIIAPLNLAVGEIVMSGPDAEIKSGNALPLKKIPLGSKIYNIELKPKHGGQIVRSAGTMAQLMNKEGEYAIVKLPSGEVRLIPQKCYATLGQVSNPDHSNICFGKAGVKRRLGRRPHVRGTAMNPIDHPHGGGEGRSPRGMPPKTPWGKPALGQKTRRNKKSDKMIIKRRK